MAHITQVDQTLNQLDAIQIYNTYLDNCAIMEKKTEASCKPRRLAREMRRDVLLFMGRLASNARKHTGIVKVLQPYD